MSLGNFVIINVNFHNIVINLRRSRDGALVRSVGRAFVRPCGVQIHSVRVGQLLR